MTRIVVEIFESNGSVATTKKLDTWDEPGTARSTPFQRALEFLKKAEKEVDQQ